MSAINNEDKKGSTLGKGVTAGKTSRGQVKSRGVANLGTQGDGNAKGVLASPKRLKNSNPQPGSTHGGRGLSDGQVKGGISRGSGRKK